MKKLVVSHLVLILTLIMVIPAYASVEMKATIGQDIHVILDFQNVTVYETIRDNELLDELTIPEIIRGNLEEQNLTDFECHGELVDFNDAEKSITVGFYLSGSDILNSTFSRETMRRTFRVRTDWRKFELNLTENFLLDFSEYFGSPLSDWNFENEAYPTYYYEYNGTVPFDPVCYFILPREATEVHVAEDMETIVFELPPSLGESLLNSPFLILGAITVAIIIAFLYRTIRKSEKHELES